MNILRCHCRSGITCSGSLRLAVLTSVASQEVWKEYVLFLRLYPEGPHGTTQAEPSHKTGIVQLYSPSFSIPGLFLCFGLLVFCKIQILELQAGRTCPVGRPVTYQAVATFKALTAGRQGQELANNCENPPVLFPLCFTCLLAVWEMIPKFTGWIRISLFIMSHDFVSWLCGQGSAVWFFCSMRYWWRFLSSVQLVHGLVWNVHCHIACRVPWLKLQHMACLPSMVIVTSPSTSKWTVQRLWAVNEQRARAFSVMF